MPDSKITALTSIGASTDPANDPLVLVDVSDTSMAASGTTKKVTLNQLLGASGTATLASATITGDLTAGGDAYLNGNEKYVYLFSNYSIGNNSRVRFRAVGAGGGSGYGGDFRISTRATNNTWNTDVLTIDSSANCIWTDGAGGTRMTLNATGLGVGIASPAYKVHSVVASGFAGAFKSSTAVAGGILAGNSVADLIVGVDASGNGRVSADTSKYLGLGSGGINDRATLDSAGNFVVGIAAVATTATDGFLYVTGCAGTPTGTPTAKTGRVPIVVDTTNNKLYFYSGGSWVAAN